MKKLAHFLVHHCRLTFVATLLLALVCAAITPLVPINTDMTKYLPDSSAMKQGVDIIKDEFTSLSMPNTIRVMFKDVPSEEKAVLKERLSSIEYVDAVTFAEGSSSSEKDGYSLFVLNTEVAYTSAEMDRIESALRADFASYDMSYELSYSNASALPAWIVIVALIMILVILFIMCRSWVEPFPLLLTIGLAIVINSGTNILRGEVSDITSMIASLLQLVLSLDYSIILVNRYRQERAKDTVGTANAPQDYAVAAAAMERAIQASFSSIASSSLTTVVGLLALVFMGFKIGADMGIVLAKGVFISCICIFTALPFLILTFRKLLACTAKGNLQLPMGKLASLESRHKYGILALFLVLVTGAFLLKGNSEIAFTLKDDTAVSRIFPKTSQTVLVFDNEDTEAMLELSRELGKNEHVTSVVSYEGTLRGMNGGDVTGDADVINGTTDGADAKVGNDNLLTGSLRGMLSGLVKNSMSMLHSDKHGLLIITAQLPDESDETTTLLDGIDTFAKDRFNQPYYLVGNAAMAWEMQDTFGGELNKITLITALSIFVVVLLTFRNFIIPLLLVILIQTSVYGTMIIIGIQGYGIYFLALLMVQSILMGATIDYAILFTSYYRERRTVRGIVNHSGDLLSSVGPNDSRPSIRDALKAAYDGSINTILTSGLIITIITAVLGYAFPNPTVGQICHTISQGAASAIILIIFILPGILAALDRFVCGQKR